MEKNTRKPTLKTAEQNKILSKPRIFFGILFLVLSVVGLLSFISYLMNWKADQSQAGTMLDKTIQSSNIFGKIGDWLVAMLVAWGITSAILMSAPLISRVLKERGTIAVERLMGMVLVMVSVQMFLNGLDHYLHR